MKKTLYSSLMIPLLLFAVTIANGQQAVKNTTNQKVELNNNGLIYPELITTGDFQKDQENYANELQNYDNAKLATVPFFQNNTLENMGGFDDNLQLMNPFQSGSSSSNDVGNCLIPRDATWTAVSRNDDGFTGPIALGFTFDLYGTSYTQCWINTNGNLTFTSGLSVYSPSGFPYNVAVVAPFWSDVDTRNVACGQIYYKLEATRLMVHYENVGYYNQHCNLINNFEVIIGTTSDPVIGIGQNVLFNYGDMQWTTGDASGGVGGFGGTAATVGINAGDNVNYIQIGRFDQDNSNYDGGGGSNDGVHYLDNQCFSFNVSNDGNIPPSFSGFPANDEITIECGETVTFTISALPPEVNQTVSTVVTTGGMCNTSVVTVDGAVSTSTVTITAAACNQGTNVLTFVATDNGSPAESTTHTLTIIIENCCAPANAVCMDATVSLDADGNASISPADVDGGSTAECGLQSITVSPNTFDCSNVGDNTVTLTITDNNGNSSSCDATVTVEDNTNPDAVCMDATVTLSGGTASVTPADVDGGSDDACGIASLSVLPNTFDCSNIGDNTVTLTVVDNNGNSSSCDATVTVLGAIPSCTITAIPANNIYTGGVPTTIYMGYGPQSVTLSAVGSGGSGFSFAWSGGTLSCYNCAAPVFAPTAQGNYTFTAVVTNSNGCTSTCTITICVLDIRVPNKPGKVYLCHVPPGNNNNPQTLQISVNAVPSHLTNHAGDRLGTCSQSCSSLKDGFVEEFADESSENDFNMEVYPNPFGSHFDLLLHSGSDGFAEVMIHDVLGRLVYTENIEISAGHTEIGFNLDNLSSGVYMLSARFNDQIQIVKIVKD